MKVIAVGGQMEKQKIADLIKKYGDGEFEAVVSNDIQAASMVKSGRAQYYVGCCATGAGGSLAGAIAILGYSKCASISMPGKQPKKDDVAKKLQDGKLAFGFTDNHVELAIPMLLEEIIKL